MRGIFCLCVCIYRKVVGSSPYAIDLFSIFPILGNPPRSLRESLLSAKVGSNFADKLLSLGSV
jgi:hypothetical protein